VPVQKRLNDLVLIIIPAYNPNTERIVNQTTIRKKSRMMIRISDVER
jgi:hypothetical protein